MSAAGSGAGKSTITFSTELSIPATLTDSLYTTALTVTIASGPSIIIGPLPRCSR